MFIDYLLTEKCGDTSKSADKQHVIEHIKSIFPCATGRKIVLQEKHNEYVLPYSISCTKATDGCRNNFVYSLRLEYASSNNRNCAQILEKVHFAIMRYFENKQAYHLIITNDELSEYYCNKAYPEFQKFERLLRNLIFIVVTKAYGEHWVEETLPNNLKPKINKNQLIESALTEMTLGELISYLFYGMTDIDFPSYIDNNCPSEKLSTMSKEELISLIEKGRPKSIWNKFLVNHIHISQPKDKLDFLRDRRNKIAHSKQFYSTDYKRSLEYTRIFIPQIEQCIEKVSIKDRITARDVVLGFGNFAVGLSEAAQRIGQMITPAIAKMAEYSQSILNTIRENVIDIPINPGVESLQRILSISDFIRNSLDFSATNTISQITSSLPIVPLIPLLSDGEQKSDDESTDTDFNIDTDRENEDNGSDK